MTALDPPRGTRSAISAVPLVKLPQKFQPPFSPEELRALLDAQDHATLTGCRNFALILFLLDTGVRASECIGVELTARRSRCTAPGFLDTS